MKKSLRGLALAIVAAVMLSACQHGVFVGHSGDLWAMVKISNSAGTQLSEGQYNAANKTLQHCGAWLGPQTPGSFEADVTSGAAYTGAGFLGAGSGAELAFECVSFSQYGLYTAPVYGLGGVVNGEIIWSESKVNNIGDCAEKTMRDWEDDGQAVYHGIHIYPSLVRTNNRTGRLAPGIMQGTTPAPGIMQGPAPAR